MKLRYTCLISLLLFIGCGSYKYLQPKPALSPAESGYIEVKNGKKDFELKKDKKYFIHFPSPQENNFYLVLNLLQKQKFNSFFTSELIDKKKYGEKIADESVTDTQSVYPIQKNEGGYYLLIDGVKENLVFDIDYRYSPQWRFKFENKHFAFKETLNQNRVNRSAYNSIGSGSHLDGTNFSQAIDSVKIHSTELDKVYKELLAIESIFPQGIVNTKDEAYENYKVLKKDLEEEMNFQTNYLSVLDFFAKESACRGNPSELIKSVEAFTGFFSKKDQLPSPIVSEAQTVIGGRLNEVVPFYDQRISGKDDYKPFDDETYMVSSLYQVGALYESAGLPTPADYSALAKFVKDFDIKSAALSTGQQQLEKIRKVIKEMDKMPPDEFFKEAVKKASLVHSRLPQQIDQTYEKYSTYRCTESLNTEIGSFTEKMSKSLAQYREAEALVPQLNGLKMQKDYSTMLAILNQNMHLDFLIEKYKDLDKMSIEEQANRTKESLKSRNWPLSEENLRKLHEDINFLNPSEILPLKSALVNELEDSLYTSIDRVSRARINKFLEDNIEVLENVDSLYSDSVFLPVYDVNFSSGSRKELLQRKADLIAHLAKMKDNEFPSKAVVLLYKQFTSKPNDNGVLKSRAIVTHGKYYKGEDLQIKRRIAECDPWAAKWIVKTKDYRRVFALPVTDNKRGKNKYIFRMYVDIPTEANFPVYDVNIKLPKVIAANAASEQWYESISLNKKLLKNEGRFTISAPSSSNDYECQITPVQMNKGKGNILEVTFFHSSFQPHALSVMVQKPIIKKN